ncbi:Uncharacterized protein HZ326_27358 [Fusarium oxysporum f. sp. albedinis]|nr:Uncharacterized protein HZ326_27358 [Fusarium oxysporum f. sp. albedinis]
MQYPPTGTNINLLRMVLHDLAFQKLDDIIYLHTTFAAALKMPRRRLAQNKSAQKHGMPQTTLSDRLRDLPSKSEITQPAQLLSKSQESRLVTWILR